MKKNLLLTTVLALSTVIFVKAQEPVTWMANDYCVGLGLAADAAALQPMQEITVGDLTFTSQEKAETAWLYKVTTDPVSFTFNEITYSTSYVQGQTNPSNGFPRKDGGYCAVAQFNSTKNGSLDVTFKFGYNKRFWVAEIPVADLEELDLTDSTAVSAYAYQYAEGANYWSGYFDPTTTPPTYYNGATPTTDPGGTYFTGVTLNIKTDHEYYVFFSGSKLMLCGLTFTAESGVSVNENISTATVVSEEYFNIIGQKLAKPQLGGLNIIVRTLSDGSVNTEKIYLVK